MAAFTGQGHIELLLDTGVDITTATNLRISYQSPSGVKGDWTGVLSGTTIISRQLSDSDVQEHGVWRLQAKYTISGRSGKGNIINYTFEKPIN